MKLSRYILIPVVAALLLYACKDPYMPKIIAQSANQLVVEGVINAGNDSTIIKLSRNVKLNSGNVENPELHAQVTVESEDGAILALEERPGGLYVSPHLNINTAKKYRLNIHSGSKTYASDFVAVNVTPPIDKINYDVDGRNVNVTVDTHDATGNTRYYRWEYYQTWEFNANYFSPSKTNGTVVVKRPTSEEIYHCWTNEKSTSVILGSTAKLSEDIFKDHTLITIPGESEKFGIKFSVLIKQYALTKQGFEFWQNLKKNTEQLGSIFDVQPSQIKGNIYCTSNPEEPVIGYLSVSTVSTNRTFITKDKLKQFTTKPFYDDCGKDSILIARILLSGRVVNEENLFFNIPETSPVYLIPLEPLLAPGGVVIGHMGAYPRCADCTIRGKVKKPDFWE